MKPAVSLLALAVLAAGSAQAADVSRVYATPDARFATSIAVPPDATVVYLSGALSPIADPAAPKDKPKPLAGSTGAQSEGIFKAFEAQLKAHGMGLGDIVSMRVYLIADPATGVMDFNGMNAAYAKYFGAAGQPNRPVRATVQVAGLAAPTALVEIEAVAAKK
jgi:enamine deaminase RidA (YjgF/YER057c/UK114 family)